VYRIVIVNCIVLDWTGLDWTGLGWTAASRSYSIQMLLLDLLTEDAWESIASYLAAPDILSFLTSHRLLERLSRRATFWNSLVRVQQQKHNESLPVSKNAGTATVRSPAEAKQRYLLQAYKDALPAVHWLGLRTSSAAPSAREGHVACMFQVAGYSDRVIVVTGGYADDPSVYCKRVGATTSTTTTTSATRTGNDWVRVRPTGRVGFTYGASLTRIGHATAVQFGGFQSGGYRGETNQVAVLTLSFSEETGLQATWRSVNCSTQSGNETASRIFASATARAYHTATLLQDRYLLVTGGMKGGSGSILDPVLLDVQTFTWMDQVAVGTGASRPSNRHGHSVVLDSCRNRLVLFGGGSGSDLLRSGTDNAQVWELATDKDWGSDLLATFPWEWRLVHDDQEEDESVADNDEENSGKAKKLTPAETLNLGRLHAGHRVSMSTIVFAFGSGRPSTNGVLAYNLAKDEFFRPSISGPLPTPRFTTASVFVEQDGFVFFHGGFAAQDGDAIADMCVLDLAPALRRDFGDSFAVDPRARPNEPVTDESVIAGRGNSRRGLLDSFMGALAQSSEAERRITANRMLEQLQASGGPIDPRQVMMLSLIADGRIQFEDDEDDADEGEDYMEDEDENDNALSNQVNEWDGDSSDESDDV